MQDTDAFAVFDFKWTAEALANIVDNAIKYTEHGTITISTVNYEMFTRIDISDTGSGIPENEQAKIFSRFYRSNAVQEQEGVGIGLYLARQIISGESGYIKVASVPGKGSTFSIFLPERMWKESYAIICMYQRIISFHTYRFFHGGTRLWRFYRQKT